MAERPFQPVPNTPLVADPTGDAIWKRWLQNLQRFMDAAVRGPGSSTDNAVARWDGTTGQFLNNSGVIIDDSNNVSGVNNLDLSGYVDFQESASPGTPASGSVLLYAKADGFLYSKDDAGTETQLGGGAVDLKIIYTDETLTIPTNTQVTGHTSLTFTGTGNLIIEGTGSLSI